MKMSVYLRHRGMSIHMGDYSIWLDFCERIEEDKMAQAALDFMLCWASKMERQMEHGAKLEEVVLTTRSEATEEVEVTPGMYTWAVRMLCKYWFYRHDLQNLTLLTAATYTRGWFMSEQTLILLQAALAVKGDHNKVKTLDYLRRAQEELQTEITRLEELQDDGQ